MSQTTERESAASPIREQSGPINLVIVSDPGSPVAEAYRSLRATVKFASTQPPVRSVLIADAGTDGQHSQAAANLAAALALGGDRTILVDANLRSPRLHTLFGAENDHGLADWLADLELGTAPPLVQTSIPQLQLMVAGGFNHAAPGLPSAADLLNTDRCAALLSQLREESEFVVVDAPPLTEVGDGLALAPRVDGVLLLVRSGKTRRAPAQRAKESLDRVGARLLGAVLTDVSKRSL